MTKTNLTRQQAVVALREVAEDFFDQGFTHGEDQAYNACFKEVARILDTSHLPESCRFNVGSGSLTLVQGNGKEVCLFGLYIDRFTNRENIGCCPQYCATYLAEFRGALNIAEALFV